MIYSEPPEMAKGYAPELEGQLKKATESVAPVAEMLREADFNVVARFVWQGGYCLDGCRIHQIEYVLCMFEQFMNGYEIQINAGWCNVKNDVS